MRTWNVPGFVSRQLFDAPPFGRPYLSKLIALSAAIESQRNDTKRVSVRSCTSVSSALMSCTLNSTPLYVTAFFGSGSKIAAGAHAWQMPHHVGMQRPEVCPSRFAHCSPSELLHSLVCVHAAAAFDHHIFQHDTTLTRMLPRRRAASTESSPISEIR